MYDTIIVGGGPAAIAAGIYVGRKKMKTLLIADSFGGQSLVSDDIRNWIGVVSISGPALAKALTDHLMAQEGIEIKMPEKALSTKEIQDGFEVLTERGDAYQTRTLIIASGGRRRRLGVPGEDKFEGKGVAYCSICDAPLFKGKAVAVVGGGNAGFEAAIDLLPYATKIYILEFGAEPKADAITQAEVKKSPLVTVITNAQTKE
ncbi:MAG: alkyl hydroperoxide reductase subunit F [Candidatus Azambacteria bacterium GW2011_GWF2_46_32]|nr:MAG: alkyl hydroperoxide reductase subunit F [Candidatus Azambacteria bacterium GW2011_GWF2_46_32]